MPQKLIWSEPRDSHLKRLRAEGVAWDVISAALGVSRNAAIERGRKIGARLAPVSCEGEQEDIERPPLPAGHCLSWSVITTGTCLEGVAYSASEQDESGAHPAVVPFRRWG